MDLVELINGVLEQARSRGGDWRRLIGITLTLLFILFTSLRRGRAATTRRERASRRRVRADYRPIEARGFPIWIWWGLLIATALVYLALLPHLTTMVARVLVAAVAVAGLFLLRSIAGRSEMPGITGGGTLNSGEREEARVDYDDEG